MVDLSLKRGLAMSQWCLLLWVSLFAGSGNARHSDRVFITGAELDPSGKTFHIYCDVSTFNTSNTKPEDLVRAFFSTPDGLVYASPFHNVYNTSRIEMPISNLNSNMNKMFTCTALLIRKINNRVSNKTFHGANSQFFGIRQDRKTIEIDESDTTTLKIISTVPIVCNHSYDCCLSLNLQLGGSRNNLAVISKCRYEICSQHWNATAQQAVIEIPLMGSRDDLNDGNQHVVVKFRPLLPSGGGELHHLFDALKIPEVPVTVKDVAPGVCTITGDPHVQQFERPDRIHYFSVGDYILYESKSNEFEIHGRSWPCARNSRASCLCGIVAREGDDVVEASMCSPRQTARNIHRANSHHHPHDDHHPHDHHTGFARDPWSVFDMATGLELRQPRNGLKGGTRVHRGRRGNQLHLAFPSGASLTIRRHHSRVLEMQLTVPPSHLHSGDGRGICGTYDNNKTNDLMDKMGVLHDCPRSRCHPDNFTKTWKLGKDQTLFLTPPTSNRTSPKSAPSTITKYCGCHENDANISGSLAATSSAYDSVSNPNSATIQCSGDADQPVKKAVCHDCDDVTNGIPPGLYGGSWVTTRATDYIDIKDDDFEDTFGAFDTVFHEVSSTDMTWPTSANVTQRQAHTMCLAAVRKSNLFRLCHGASKLIGETVQECVDDFLAADGDSLVNTTTRTFSMLCLERLQKDPKNFVPDAHNNDKLVVVKEIMDDICDQDCDEHGHCQNGQCICDHGWSGSSCTLEVGKGVQLYEFIGGNVCDKAKRPCRDFLLDADNLESSSQLICRFQEHFKNGTLTGNYTQARGRFHSTNTLRCELHLSSHSTYQKAHAYFDVSASIDGGHTFGNNLLLEVKDSRCEDDSGWGCVIDGLCYRNETVRPGNILQTCNTYLNASAWSLGSFTAQLSRLSNGEFGCILRGNAQARLHLRKQVTWIRGNGHVVSHQHLHGPGSIAKLSLHYIQGHLDHYDPNQQYYHIACSFKLTAKEEHPDRRWYTPDSLTVTSEMLTFSFQP